MARNGSMNRQFMLLAFVAQLALAIATCYYPNGDTATGHFPCNATADASVCCAETFQCMSNGLCLDPRYPDFGRVLRGGCTDENGGEGTCPDFCLNEWPQGDQAVYYCGNGEYCCSSEDCCSNGTVSKLDLGAPQVTATAVSVSQRPSISSDPANPASDRPAAASTSSTAESHNGSTNTVAIGVGVGVGVGVVLGTCLIAACIFFRRRRRRTEKPQAELPQYEYRRSLDNDGLEETIAGRREARKSLEKRDVGIINMSGERVHELDAERPPRELHGEELGKDKEEVPLGTR
ncbi:hypothetical protein CC78DRAFT_587165 [Lojkania enalia]|uniref:Mid2 domain-containing protein n=1 Tax=Lojkania enalia TaxID=147567 RepID=A0A9P4K2R2_9PLEO|nr:hypothetical protein CC78DRAFT_587165 [Didymosphaeria enalia]